MRTLFAILLAATSCESGARAERPAAAPDASVASALEPRPSSLPNTSATVPSAAPSATAPSAAAPSATAAVPAPSATPPHSAPAELRPCRVALIGDSLTDTRVGGGYVRYLEKHSPRSRFVNFAKGGAMVNQMKRQLDAMLADPEGAFTHLVVFGGVNDLYSDETAGRTVTKIETDLGALYAAGRARGLRVVAVTVAPWGGFAKYYNPRRGAATRTLNTWILAGPSRGDVNVVVDAYALLSCGDPERLCPRFTLEKNDGLHFGKLGHEALGKALHAAEFARCS
ncbi:MAG TPA: SGNH/GDSL hydrolase family protein [Polyangiaceae bacterium]